METQTAHAYAEIQKIILSRLYGEGEPITFDGWLTDEAAKQNIMRKIYNLGQAPAPKGASVQQVLRTPFLGKELTLELIMVFLGLCDPVLVPQILEDYGLIDELECDELYLGLATDVDPETPLFPIVQKAYMKLHNPSGRLN